MDRLDEDSEDLDQVELKSRRCVVSNETASCLAWPDLKSLLLDAAEYLVVKVDKMERDKKGEGLTSCHRQFGSELLLSPQPLSM